MLDIMVRALITGANRGIGLALTGALVERGVFIFAGARRPEAAGELEDLRKHSRDRLQVVPLEVTSLESVRSCVDAVKHVTDSLDILVNNAAVFLEESDMKLAELDMGYFDQTFAVNLTGVARVTQAFLPLLFRGNAARIVNISSGAASIADRTDHHYYCYGASKAALNHLTAGLARELGPRGITVTAVSPGWVRTDMGGPNADLSPRQSADAIADTLLKLKPEDSGCFLDRFGRKGVYVW